MDSLASIEKPLVLLGCAYLSWKIVKHIWSSMNNVEKEPVTVLVTGAAGRIGYTLVPMIARGLMLGPDQPVFIRMLDVERPFFIETMNSLKMELIDSAFPLLKGVAVTTDLVEACTDADIAILLDGFPRKRVMKRKDVLMRKNMQIYKARASALEQYASPDCKVLAVGDMANTDALVLKQFAPSIPEKNITCLTRLDHNRALAQLSERLNVPVSDLKNVVIWGNHSPTQYPDASRAMAETCKGPKLVTELIDDQEWLKTEFVSTVQDRCGARDHSTALSTASSACDHIRDWILGTPKGTWVSMGVCSDGSYGVPHGLMYSFPVTCEKGNWSIVQGLKIDEFSREKMDTTAQELIEEKSLAYSYMN